MSKLQKVFLTISSSGMIAYTGGNLIGSTRCCFHLETIIFICVFASDLICCMSWQDQKREEEDRRAASEAEKREQERLQRQQRVDQLKQKYGM